MKHLLEIRTTISATPFFFRRIHYMAASLRAIGGRLADHEFVVSVGSEGPPENFYRTLPWSNLYPILWRRVDPQAFREQGYRATNRDRASHMARARLVMMADADVIFVKDFSDLIDAVIQSPAICGVMAHFSPFLHPPTLTAHGAQQPAARQRRAAPDQNVDDAVYWQLLAQSFNLDTLPMTYEVSGASCYPTDSTHRRAPAYFNGGMVLGPVDLMDEMCRLFPAAEEAIDSVMKEDFFRPQAARTLAIYKSKLPHRALPLRYNFPNDPPFDAHYGDELRDVRILHYLRKNIVDRDAHFESRDAVERLLRRTDLKGSNEVLRVCLSTIHESVASEESR